MLERDDYKLYGRRYKPGGFFIYAGAFFCFLWLLSGGFVVLPIIILIVMILITYGLFFYKDEDGEREIDLFNYSSLPKDKKDAVEGLVYAWIIAIIVSTFLFNSFW